nr:MAG: hypothetical protein [Caudoviricetes sp.]
MTQARNLGNIGDAISGSSNTNISFDANTLFIDSANNRVGIKTSSPTEDIEVSGNTNISGYISGTSLSVTNNTTTTNATFSGTATLQEISSSGNLSLSTNNGANTTQFLSNGTLVLSNSLYFPDGTTQSTKASGGLNTGVSQTVTATANTTVDLTLGDVVDINMSNNITTLSFTNANENQIVLVNLIMDANTRTVSNIANCSSSVVIGYKDSTFSFQLFTVDSGANWVYKTVGNNFDSGRKSLWSWGFNGNGQLGLGDITHRSSPVQVGSLTNWSQVSGSLAIKTDGTLWSWGSNFGGELGLGDRTHRSSPVQVGLLTNWSLVAGGQSHSLAIKTDGTLWSWGGNNYGELGLGDITNRSSPVQIGSLTNWSQVSGGLWHSLAIKTDGTLWSWGRNTWGQLGLGNLTHRSSPVQVGFLTNWSLVASGGYQQSFAIKTDGTLWSWGRNEVGQLGLGDTTHRSSPVQVGSLTNWSKVAGGSQSLAIKTDGTLWSWGTNSIGELGLGDRTSRSSPVQVGSLTNWSLVAGGSGHSLAL